MKKIIANYLKNITKKFSHVETSEYGYRTDFELLLKDVFKEINVSRFDHDSKAKGGNKPDFVVIKKDVPLLYIETKDIGISLDKVEKSEQMSRYFGYANLVLTDYLEFRFYRNGESYGKPIKIGEYDIKKRIITPNPKNYEYLAKTLIDFTKSHKEPIRSGKHLAKIMGGKAQRIRENLLQILGNKNTEGSELVNLYETIKKLLIHDLKLEDFADMYAQTLVYGLFVARFHDKSLDTFTRQEARDLIPASNPFLGHFFDHIAGRNFEKRLEYITDELCEVFSHANVAVLLRRHFEKTANKGIKKGQDQIIHFYEDFLKEYDDKLRKKMGAYYTPLPIVRFIVRSVDHLIEKEFGLVNGLADTTKLENGLHKVQILDPAVGTGTFISNVIGEIYKRILKQGQKGRWPSYVHHDLLPRLFGFEIMMAPYTIAHLKLSMALKDTGFKYFNKTRKGKDRLGIYLTNSLEGTADQTNMFDVGFGASIAKEASEAAKIKNDNPIMIILGNPPYSISSSNKSEWIQKLINIYKENLSEKKINLDDDYIKFIRFAEHFVEKNKEGIVAMITNNSFIDGITHRQMRKHLLETFDDIYILDLHGSSKKKEKTPNGGKDENVFDIQQGVSINIFVRKKTKKEGLGKIHYAEIFGKRQHKFKTLDKLQMNKVAWKILDVSSPYYFFVPRDTKAEAEYLQGFGMNEIFSEYNSGIQSKRDKLCFPISKKGLKQVIDDFILIDSELIRIKYNLPKDGRDWKIEWAKKDLQRGYSLEQVLYRPFDLRTTAYTGKSKGFIAYPRQKTFKHFLEKNNVGLVTVRQQSTYNFQHALVTQNMIESGAISLQTKEWGYIFPLYLFTEDGIKKPNLERAVIDKIEETVGNVSPENILDYIYAVLYSQKYRKKYSEFLKIDFPRVPYPKDKGDFNKLVNLGAELRQLHLLESPKINKYITSFPVADSDVVEKKPKFIDGKVFINETQYFGKVPEEVWNFYVGGHQPAQKWLKDRKNKTLISDDIEHYQRIIVALDETIKIMGKIDKVFKS